MFRGEMKAAMVERTVNETGVMDVNGLNTALIADRMNCVLVDIRKEQEADQRARIFAAFQRADPLRAFRRLSELRRAGGLDGQQQAHLAAIRSDLLDSLLNWSLNRIDAYKWIVENEGVQILLDELTREQREKQSYPATMSDDEIACLFTIIYNVANELSVRDRIRAQMKELHNYVSRFVDCQIDLIKLCQVAKTSNLIIVSSM